MTDAVKEARKAAKKEIKHVVEPIVAELFKESISSKVVLSGLSKENPDGMGPYWIAYACIEHLTGVQMLPVTLGRYFPDLNNPFMAELQENADLIISKQRGKYSPDEAGLIYETFVEQVKSSFEEVEVAQHPGEYFDLCCKFFPGKTTTQARKDFVAFQTRQATKIAGAKD